MKKILMVLTIVLALVLCLPTVVYAEDAESESWSDYFKDVWLERIVTALTVAAGIIGGLAVTLNKILKLTKSTESALNDVESREFELSKLKTAIDAAEKSLELSRDANEKLTTVCLEGIKAEEESMRKRDEEIAKIKKMLYIFATNDNELVKKGYAKEVAEVAGYEEE